MSQHLVERLDREVVAGVRVVVPSMPELKVDVEQARTGLVGASGPSERRPPPRRPAIWGIAGFATASTCAAISGVTGAAANATLAWLRGGSLAAGGGGMAAGAIVLNLIMIAPVALITGFTVGVIGAKQKTKARAHAAEIAVPIERMETARRALHRSVDERMGNCRPFSPGWWPERSTPSTYSSRSTSIQMSTAPTSFERCNLLPAIGDVIETPVLDADTGQLTDVSIKVVEKYP